MSSENGNDYYYLYSSETNKYNYIGKSANNIVRKEFVNNDGSDEFQGGIRIAMPQRAV